MTAPCSIQVRPLSERYAQERFELISINGARSSSRRSEPEVNASGFWRHCGIREDYDRAKASGSASSKTSQRTALRGPSQVFRNMPARWFSIHRPRGADVRAGRPGGLDLVRIVKKLALKIGLDAGNYAGHPCGHGTLPALPLAERQNAPSWLRRGIAPSGWCGATFAMTTSFAMTAPGDAVPIL